MAVENSITDAKAAMLLNDEKIRELSMHLTGIDQFESDFDRANSRHQTLLADIESTTVSIAHAQNDKQSRADDLVPLMKRI